MSRVRASIGKHDFVVAAAAIPIDNCSIKKRKKEILPRRVGTY